MAIFSRRTWFRRLGHCAPAPLLLLALGGCEAIEKYLAKAEHRDAREEQAKARQEAEAKGEQYRRKGPDFSVAIPKGYTEIVDPKALAAMGPGGFGFAADERGGEGWFLASIAFAPVAPGATDIADDDACKQAAAGTAAASNTNVLRDAMVTIGAEQRCQWELSPTTDENRRALGTVMKSASQMWVVTCNHDARDETAKSTCISVLEGWKNDA